MASIANDYDPNNPNANDNTGGGGTVTSSGGATGDDGSGGGQGAPSASQSYQPPNVSQYLAANQGAGEQLSGAIQGNVQNQANKVEQGINTTQGQLSKQYEPLNQNLQQGQQVAKAAFKDPQALLDSYNAAKTQSTNTPLASDQQQNVNAYNQFQQLNTGGYNPAIQAYGTAAQQGYNNLQPQVANINQQSKAAANELGRGQLLQNTVAQPNYSPGQQTLDQLFLQGQGNQLKQNLGGIAKQTGQQLNSATGDVQNKLQALQGLSGQNQAYIKNLFTNGGEDGTGLNQIAGNVANEYAHGQEQAAQLPALLEAAKNGKLNQDQIAQLGLTSGTHTWGINDLTPYIQQNALTGNAQTATPEEFARYNALNQLAGGGQSPLQASIFGNQTSAGGYTPATFQNDAFNTAVADKQKTLQSDYQKDLGAALGNFNLHPAAPQDTNGGAFGNQTIVNGGASQILTGNPLPGAINNGNFGGPGEAQAGGKGSPLANQIASAYQAGQLTPEQAYQMIQSGTSGLASQYGLGQDYWQSAYQPFLDFYNNQYAPAASSTITPSNTKKAT